MEKKQLSQILYKTRKENKLLKKVIELMLIDYPCGRCKFIDDLCDGKCKKLRKLYFDKAKTELNNENTRKQ